MKITFVDASLADDLLWSLDVISSHGADHGCCDALAFCWIVLEIKCHLVTLISCPTCIQSIMPFGLRVSIIYVVKIDLNPNRSLNLTVILILLLLRRHLIIIPVIRINISLTTALLLRTRINELTHAAASRAAMLAQRRAPAALGGSLGRVLNHRVLPGRLVSRGDASRSLCDILPLEAANRLRQLLKPLSPPLPRTQLEAVEVWLLLLVGK